MKRLFGKTNPWLGAIALGAVFFTTLTLSGQHPRSSNPEESALSPPPTPLRYTLRILRVAGEPFTYLSLMGQAVAATVPTILPDGTPLAEAEVTLTRVGPLRIGMTIEEGADALGIPLLPLGASAGGDCAYYQPGRQDAAMGLMVVNNRIIRIDVWPNSPLKTASGLKVGSTEAEILAQYPPEQVEIQANPDTEGNILTFVPTDPELRLFRLVFETDSSGTVIQYRLGQFPAVTWPEGCA